MGGLSIWHYLILGVVILLLFGKGRFSGMMGDVAEGIKSFKKGMADDDAAPPPQPSAPPPTRIEGRSVNDAPAATTETRESDHTA